MIINPNKTNFKGYTKQQSSYFDIPIDNKEIPMAKMEIIKIKDVIENLYKNNIITKEFYNQYSDLLNSANSTDLKIAGWFGDTWKAIKKGYWSTVVPSDMWGRFGYVLRSFKHLEDILMVI